MPLTFRPAALAALLMISAGAFAQQAPAAAAPPPPPAGPMAAPRPAGPAPGEALGTAPVLSGTVQRWLVNPNGQADGLLLTDGTQVSFPPHLSASAMQMLKPGDAVQVSGWRAPNPANASVVRATSLTATASGRRIADEPPAAGSAPPAPPAAGSLPALTAMSASGRVSQLLYTDRGDARGVILDNGTIVRFPPHAGADMAGLLKAGSPLTARGWGSRTAQGSALEATAIGDSATTMRELFAGPGQEPGAGPRGPKGERGPRGKPVSRALRDAGAPPAPPAPPVAGAAMSAAPQPVL